MKVRSVLAGVAASAVLATGAVAAMPVQADAMQWPQRYQTCKFHGRHWWNPSFTVDTEAWHAYDSRYPLRCSEGQYTGGRLPYRWWFHY